MFEITVTVLGIGFLLFIHEAGHFLAARAAGVRVEVFSLGFGPRIWGFKRGDTDYRLALIPLGGYVKMSGEEDSAESGGLLHASANWRILIFSGGILANFLFSLILIPILFGFGIPLEAPVAGVIQPGGVAWEAGLQTGDRLIDINGEPIHAFRHFSSAVALSGAEMDLDLTFSREDEVHKLSLRPRYDESAGFSRLGVDVPTRITFFPSLSETFPGISSDHSLFAWDGTQIQDQPEVALSLLANASRTLPPSLPISAVDQSGQTLPLELTPIAIPLDANSPKQIGISLLENHVLSVRPPLHGILNPGDTLFFAPSKEPIPNRDALIAALFQSPNLSLLVQRPQEANLQQVSLSQFSAQDILRQLQLGKAPTGPLEVFPHPKSPAENAGVVAGDILVRAGDKPIYSVQDLKEIVAQTPNDGAFDLSVMRGETPLRLSIQPSQIQRYHYGFAQEVIQETVQAKGPIEALQLGLSEAHRMGGEVFRTLSRVLSGGIDSRNLGGILTIGALTHSFAEQGWIPFFFFLCLISIHLGVLNLLPIPGLDGGHLMFVLYEKIRGKPLSLHAQGAINLIGLLLVVGLLIFVTSLDIQRFFFS